MINSEWALVFFTLIAQMSVGAFIFQEILIHYGSHSHPDILKLKNRMLWVLLPLMVLAVFLSFFHLGKPGHAIYSLDNLRTSWLSHEILMISVFTFLLAAYAFIFRMRPSRLAFLRAISFLTILAGAFLIFSMIKIYMLKTIPVWDSFTTAVEFIACSLILGASLLLVLFERTINKPSFQEISYLANRIHILSLIFLIALLADTGNAIFLFFQEKQFVNIPECVSGLSVIRIALQMLAVIILLSHIISFRKHLQFKYSRMVIVFIILLIAEIIGRYGFYEAFVSPVG